LSRTAELLGLEITVVQVLAWVLVLLSGGTLARLGWLLLAPGEAPRERLRSLGTWWTLYLVFITLLVLGPLAVILAMVTVSLLGLREAMSIVEAQHLLVPLGTVACALYGLIWVTHGGLLTLVLPLVFMALIMPLLAAMARTRTRAGPKNVNVLLIILCFGETVVGPAYVVVLITLSLTGSKPDTWAGWILALALLTELNDMAQAWWGRTLGRHLLAPSLSPGKTWEGLLGGMGTTMASAWFLLPLLTPVGQTAPHGPGGWDPSWLHPWTLGAILALAGVGGDLTASLIKRRGGVKDAGDLLPAHGGVMDRFDSLALTAPILTGLAFLFWIGPW